MATFFFCGIGGIGMSAIALYLKKSGHLVIGSDRSFDNHQHNAVKTTLEAHGILLVSQDGKGVPEQTDIFVVSSAIEESVPDIKRAKELSLTIKKRAEVLADIFHAHRGIAVAGTSGKTTVTAMIGHILAQLNLSPTMINGGIGLNTYNGENPSNLIYGNSDICVIEADESDGSIALYTPYIGVLTNVSLDHKPISETLPLFSAFLNRAEKGVVINADCQHTPQLALTHANIVSFSVSGNEATLQANHIQYTATGVEFTLLGKRYHLPFIGRHNLENALAAISACLHLEIAVEESITALQTFLGTKRRLQTIGSLNGITVIDDYAHNPEKIKASLSALQLHEGRLFVIYQPHGFSPLRMMKNDLIHMLQEQLDSRTIWIMNDVFYAGGTVTRDISSNDIIAPVQASGKEAFYLPTRAETFSYLQKNAKLGDRIVVMGARDDTLTDFATQILTLFGGEK